MVVTTPIVQAKQLWKLLCRAGVGPSFLSPKVELATARAGNVIGGGDWSSHRIVPDLVVALQHKNELELRNPDAVRPWQHVLDPLFGYLKLAEVLYTEDKNIFQTSFNFGPGNRSTATVIDLVNSFGEAWGEVKRSVKNSIQHEAPFFVFKQFEGTEFAWLESRWDFQRLSITQRTGTKTIYVVAMQLHYSGNKLMHTQPKFEDSTSNLTDEELKSKILQLTREYSQRRHHNSGVGATKKNFWRVSHKLITRRAYLMRKRSLRP